MADWTDALRRADAHSPFLSRALERQPDLAQLLAAGDGAGALAWAEKAGDGMSVRVALRRRRLALATALGVGDLGGAFDLAMVIGTLSRFADEALDAAIAEAILNRAPDSEPTGFTGLALGKHGAGELNYSSDIDPILLYDPQRLPRRERDEPGEAAQRVARRVVETLGQVTEDGYVFRVDLRLRPASEVTPLAISFDAALSHYESSALAWERAAFIRARACAGDIGAGEDFLASITPFVWRRSLDFNALDDIRRLTARIRSAYAGPRDPGPGFDVKKGRGGIREVEFFAQTHQLIHGGRNPALRVRGTRAALDALADARIVPADTATMLGDSYDRLRAIEHRLQMVSDQQTHSLPRDAAALENVAALGGWPDGAALVEEVRCICEGVGREFDALIADDSPSQSGGGDWQDRLGCAGFDDGAATAKRVDGWFDGRIRALRSDTSRAAFDAVAPDLFAALGRSSDAAQAFTRFESLLSALPSAVNLFRLLEARPALLDQLVQVLVLAPPLAEELARRPALLDPLIDRSAFDLPGPVEAIAKRLAGGGTMEYEPQLDAIRRIVGELRFLAGVQLIEGAQDPLDIARGLSRIAEAAIVVAAEAAEREFAEAHGIIADGELLVLGLGRLGGGVLTHASDLDLIYLFDAPPGAESTGEREMGATRYYNRLAQRVTAALSVPTAEGALYEVDTRLRPQGNQGPLASSLDAFARYQREDAWTWEHMALTRARPLHGSPEGRARLQQLIDEILQQDREPDVLRRDVLKMRAEMAAHKKASGPLDAKLSRGGLVDCEFLVHFLQLRERTAFSPDLHVALAGLERAGLVSPDVLAAHELMTRLLVAARLLAPRGEVPDEAAQAALARACGCGDFSKLQKRFDEARHAVAECWTGTFGEQLEMTQ
ncbi:bifunctional [glutamine synthetase] adenylyltransferase/[glutamine synthetase]-adenylyl-L-tyrosine phosphorylase [Altererythrobacter sp. CAU 1778]